MSSVLTKLPGRTGAVLRGGPYLKLLSVMRNGKLEARVGSGDRGIEPPLIG